MKRKTELLRLVLTALFIAVIAVLSFTTIGYLKLGVIEITFLVVPVVAGGILLGKWGGLVLGLAFGLSSFFQCFGMSAFGAAMLGVQPVFAAVVCIVPRVLLGFFAAWLFEGLSGLKCPAAVSGALSFLCGSLINTICFVGLLVLLFGKSEMIVTMMQSMQARSLLAFAAAFAGVNSLVEAGVNAVLGAALAPVLIRLKKRM